MAASAGACKRLAVQGVEGARVTFRREMRTDTSLLYGRVPQLTCGLLY